MKEIKEGRRKKYIEQKSAFVEKDKKGYQVADIK